MGGWRKFASAVQRIAAEELGIEPHIGTCIRITQYARRPRNGQTLEEVATQLVLANRDMLVREATPGLKASIGERIMTPDPNPTEKAKT